MMNGDVFIYIIISFLISVGLIPLILYYTRKHEIYDRSDGRKIHTHPVPRIGGLAIFLAFFTSVLLLFFNYVEKSLPFNIFWYFAAMLMAFFIGFVDDLRHIPARYKLAAQIMTGVFVSLSGLTISELAFTEKFSIQFHYFSHILTVFWVVGFMNAINLIDGMDGLASGIMIIANLFIVTLAWLQGNPLVFQLSFILTAAILGFYIYNFPPAKIFMGDGGAYFLGFMYATIPLMGIKKSAVLTLFLFPLVLLLLPLYDILSVIFKRMRLGYNIFRADKNHIHHRLLHLGFTIKGILVIVYLMTIILGLFSILLIKIEMPFNLLIFLLIFLIMALFLYVIHSAERVFRDRNNPK